MILYNYLIMCWQWKSVRQPTQSYYGMPLNIVHSIMRQPLFMSYNFNAFELGSLFSTATAGLCETFVRE